MSTVMDIFDLAKTLSESDRARLTDFVFTTSKKVLCKNIRKRSAIPLLA